MICFKWKMHFKKTFELKNEPQKGHKNKFFQKMLKVINPPGGKIKKMSFLWWSKNISKLTSKKVKLQTEGFM